MKSDPNLCKLARPCNGITALSMWIAACLRHPHVSFGVSPTPKSASKASQNEATQPCISSVAVGRPLNPGLSHTEEDQVRGRLATYTWGGAEDAKMTTMTTNSMVRTLKVKVKPQETDGATKHQCFI